MNHTCYCLPSWSWYSFTDPGGMEGWVGLGWMVGYIAKWVSGTGNWTRTWPPISVRNRAQCRLNSLIEANARPCQGGYVLARLFLFLSVWLLATTNQIFVKILPEVYLWAEKNLLNLESHPPLNPDSGIFEELFNIVRYYILRQLGSYLGKTDGIFVKILS